MSSQAPTVEALVTRKLLATTRPCARDHRLQSAIENVKTCPERAKRVEWIANVIVPVVQRIERRFPNSNGFPSHEGSKCCWSCQKAPIPVSNGHLSGNKWRRPKSTESTASVYRLTLNDGGNGAKRHAVTEYATDSSDRLRQDRKIPEEIARPASGLRTSFRVRGMLMP
jgi:hypothetical protein